MTFTAGSKLRASDLNAELGVTVTHAPNDSGTVNSTAYVGTRTGGTNPVGTSFVAPTSGKVLVHWACGLVSAAGNATATMLVSFRLGQGATVGGGTQVLAPADTRAIQHAGTTDQQAGRTSLVTGLTPGAVYNVQLMYRGVAAMAVGSVEITVQPTT